MSAVERPDESVVPETMKARVLGGADQSSLKDKPGPRPGTAEVPVRIDAMAVCATNPEITSPGPSARIETER